MHGCRAGNAYEHGEARESVSLSKRENKQWSGRRRIPDVLCQTLNPLAGSAIPLAGNAILLAGNAIPLAGSAILLAGNAIPLAGKRDHEIPNDEFAMSQT